MTKIKLMGVREEDEPYIEMWSQQHEVEVEMSKEQLTEDNVQSITVSNITIIRNNL